MISDDNSFSVYNDVDEFFFLRSASGGHDGNISHLVFDYHLSLLATSDNNGEIAIWDYETSQLLAHLLKHKT